MSAGRGRGTSRGESYRAAAAPYPRRGDPRAALRTRADEGSQLRPMLKPGLHVEGERKHISPRLGIVPPGGQDASPSTTHPCVALPALVSHRRSGQGRRPAGDLDRQPGSSGLWTASVSFALDSWVAYDPGPRDLLPNCYRNLQSRSQTPAFPFGRLRTSAPDFCLHSAISRAASYFVPSPSDGGGGNRTRVRGRTGQSVYKLRLPLKFALRPVGSRPTVGLVILWVSHLRR